jgi:hypothetical protein
VKWEELTPQSSSVVVARKGQAPDGEVVSHAPAAKPSVLHFGIGVTRDIADLLVGTSVGFATILRLGFEPTAGHGLTLSLLGQLPTMLGGSTFEANGLEVGGVQGRIGYRWAFEVSRFWFGIGPEAGGGVWIEKGKLNNPATNMIELRHEAAVSPFLGVRGTARLKLFSIVSMCLDLDFAAGFLAVNGALSFLPLPSATLGVAVDL